MSSALKGNCYLCGEELNTRVAKNHFLKKHNVESGEQCYLLKVVYRYDKSYWLMLDIPLGQPLSELDSFLRDIWLECCGHMSCFSRTRGVDLDFSMKMKSFTVGEEIYYDYDMGSTTELIITIVAQTTRAKQKEAVRLLARNAAQDYVCCECGKKPVFIQSNGWGVDASACYCKKCANKLDDDEMIYTIANSPRMGVCGYSGDLDVYEFKPKKVVSVKPDAQKDKKIKTSKNTVSKKSKPILVHYSKCSTCKKAVSLLDSLKLEYEAREIKSLKPTENELREWHKISGLPLKKFFNTSGIQYRELGLKDKLADMTEDEQLALLASDEMLVKRPILVYNQKVLVGFNAESWEEAISSI